MTGRLPPDHKFIADFRKDNRPEIQAACAQFGMLCGQVGLFGTAAVAIDGSKFKAVNTRQSLTAMANGEVGGQPIPDDRRAHRLAQPQ